MTFIVLIKTFVTTALVKCLLIFINSIYESSSGYNSYNRFIYECSHFNVLLFL